MIQTHIRCMASTLAAVHQQRRQQARQQMRQQRAVAGQQWLGREASRYGLFGLQLCLEARDLFQETVAVACFGDRARLGEAGAPFSRWQEWSQP